MHRSFASIGHADIIIIIIIIIIAVYSVVLINDLSGVDVCTE